MEAAHADEALHILAAVPDVQIVVADVEMPRGSINGFELARRVREDRQDIGVLISSGRIAPHLGTCRRAPTSSKSPFVLKDCLSWSERCSFRAESATNPRSWHWSVGARLSLGYGRPAKSASFRVRQASSDSHL
jgi:hypothetical protein